MLAGLGWVARPSTSGITYLRARAHTLARYGKVTPQCSLVMEYHRELVAIYGQMRTCYEKKEDDIWSVDQFVSLEPHCTIHHMTGNYSL